MPLTTTMGQLLVNEALPEDMRDYRRVMDKKTLQATLADLARNQPEKYVNIVDRLMRVGRSTVESGNFSLSLSDFKAPAYKKTRMLVLKSLVNSILDSKLPDEKKQEKIVSLLADEVPDLTKKVLEQSYENGTDWRRSYDPDRKARLASSIRRWARRCCISTIKTSLCRFRCFTVSPRAWTL